MPTTLSMILADVRSRLDERITPRFWTDAELTTWINESLRDISRRTETLQQFSTTVSITPSQNKYTLPANVIRVHRVEFVPSGAQQTYTVQASTYQEMDQIWGISQNMQQSSYPYYYVLWGFTPSLVLQLYPVPAQAGNLNLFYYRLPAVLVSSSDVAEIPEGWHDLCSLYCEFVAKRKDRDPTWQEAKQLYDDTITQMIEITRQWHDQARTISVGVNSVPEWLYGGIDY